MNIRQGLLGMAGTFLYCSAAAAGNMALMLSSHNIHPVVSLQSGYASINVGGNTQRFNGTDSDVFTYKNTGNGQNAGFVGVFLGAEHPLPWVSQPAFFMQTGVEYNYFSNIDVRGTNTVGIEPLTSTTYKYKYNFQTQQVLGVLKLFATYCERFHPYAEVGLGGAFNHAGEYNATTTETGSINLTPGFSGHHQTRFSYSVGLGVDTRVNANIRVGLGYRYSNVGSSSLGNGAVTFNNYQSPVAFSIGNAKAYANQVIASISYVA